MGEAIRSNLKEGLIERFASAATKDT